MSMGDPRLLRGLGAKSRNHAHGHGPGKLRGWIRLVARRILPRLFTCLPDYRLH
jgi:hypothetical protein